MSWAEAECEQRQRVDPPHRAGENLGTVVSLFLLEVPTNLVTGTAGGARSDDLTASQLLDLITVAGP